MDRMSKKIAMAGLGALAVTREKAEKLIDELAEKGKMDGEDIKRFFNELVDKGRRTGSSFTAGNTTGHRTSSNDLQSLELRVSRIESMLGIEQSYPQQNYTEGNNQFYTDQQYPDQNYPDQNYTEQRYQSRQGYTKQQFMENNRNRDI